MIPVEFMEEETIYEMKPKYIFLFGFILGLIIGILI